MAGSIPAGGIYLVYRPLARFALRGRYWCKVSTPPAEKNIVYLPCVEKITNAFEFNDLRAFCYLGNKDYIETIKTRIRAEYKARKGKARNSKYNNRRHSAFSIVYGNVSTRRNYNEIDFAMYRRHKSIIAKDIQNS